MYRHSCGSRTLVERVWKLAGAVFSGIFATAGVPAQTLGTHAADKTDIVETSSGPVAGSVEGGVDRFLGLPYAAAPVGPLRWRAPAPAPTWRAVRSATRFSDWCLQVAPAGFSKPIVNEDCLYLNVFAPHGASASMRKRPVIVWIHGGGLRQGRANDYDPTPMVTKGDVVFVSFNYRLNVLGFLTSPALRAGGGGASNFGMLDQQAVLAWVRRNIASFGGDPNNVTLMGESSGGANVFNHLVSPTSAGMFNKAIVQSGSLWFGSFAPFYDGLPLGQADEVGQKVAALTNCTGLREAECLRALTPDKLAEIVRALPSYAFGVVVDGHVLKDTVTNNILAGRFARVPIINGSNRDEWTWVEGLSEHAAGKPLTEAELEQHAAKSVGAFAVTAAPHYPASAFGGSAGAASARLITDGLFMCPLLTLNAVLARYVPVWGYEFADDNAPYPFPSASFRYGAAHTLEMQYLFRGYTGAVGTYKALSSNQQRLSRTMVAYWTRFASVGNPNSKSVPRWPVQGRGKSSFQSLVAPSPSPIAADSIDRAHHCSALWGPTLGRSALKSGR
jgi:para-nitrobenzyl esterase